jgi:hypothetical protein
VIAVYVLALAIGWIIKGFDVRARNHPINADARASVVPAWVSRRAPVTGSG